LMYVLIGVTSLDKLDKSVITQMYLFFWLIIAQITYYHHILRRVKRVMC
jgi:hypothetical protein